MKDNRGFTLVEVLASLTILGIVFIGFMTVFPQMTKFNEKTEDKLVTMNLAKQELARISNKSDILGDMQEINEEIKRYTHSDENGFDYVVDYYVKPDLDKTSFDNFTKFEEVISLHKLHIKIIKNGITISETFGYIEGD